jgi:hypothetical protein
MTNTVFDPGQVAQIANEIYRIVTILDSQLKTLEATPSKRDVDYNLLEQIEMGTGILGINVTDLMSFETSPTFRQAVFDTVYPFPSRFVRDARLEVILSYVYVMVLAFQKNIPYEFFRNGLHHSKAIKLMEANVKYFQGLVRVRP